MKQQVTSKIGVDLQTLLWYNYRVIMENVMKTIDEINELLEEAARLDREEFEREQEEAEIDLLSERMAAEEFARYAIENDLSYAELSKGW
jgi:predicted transcriptional regulator